MCNRFYFDIEIDSIKNRAGYFLFVLQHLLSRADTWLFRAIETTGAGVTGSYKNKVCRELKRIFGA